MKKNNSNDISTISVVVPTIGDGSLPQLRQALEQQTLYPDEIIIVQDKEKRGAAWARNQGIKKASGIFIAFLDDDCIPPDGWLENLFYVITCFQADIVGGTYAESDSFLLAKRSRLKYPSQSGYDEFGLVGAGGNIMYRTAVLQEIQSLDSFIFNENFRISQDWELIWRARSQYYTVAYTPVRVKHLKQVTPLSYLRMQFNRGRGIYMLNQVRKKLPASVALHGSLLWGSDNVSRGGRWLQIIWRKILGPFEVKSFDSLAHFFLFWLGEKAQGLGFIQASIYNIDAKSEERFNDQRNPN